MSFIKERVITHYDSLLYTGIVDEYWGWSEFANFGFWDKHTIDAKQASCNLMEKLLAFIPEKSGTILDVACGKGGTTRYLLKYYPPSRVTAINVSEKQLKTARCSAPGGAFLVADAANLSFADNSFDNIICVEAAFHFYTREKFLREALRVLKSKGNLVLSDVLMDIGVEEQTRTFHEQNYLPNPEHYAALCREVGFSEVEVVDATKPCWQGHYWNMVRFFHTKYLSKEIELVPLKTALHNTYKLATVLTSYLLVGLRKG